MLDRTYPFLVGLILLGLTAGCGAGKAARVGPEGEKMSQKGQELIKKGLLQPGMTADQARKAKGKPDHVYVMEGGWGSFEQWVYGGYDPEFVYLLNGRVTER